MLFEIIISLLVVGLIVLVFRLIVGKDDSESARFRQTMNMEDRIKRLEDSARYIADQPQQASFYSNASMSMHYDALQNAYAMQANVNEVPINDVVKAIVKHLDMQIEKVLEQTTKTPQEVKVVPKPVMSSIIMTSPQQATWGLAEKPKRKYTKRKPAVKPAVKKTTRKTK